MKAERLLLWSTVGARTASPTPISKPENGEEMDAGCTREAYVET